MERLSKCLARFSAFSRRRSEELIRAGRVRVNGVVVVEPQHKVTPAVDVIVLDNKVIDAKIKYINIALYKPVGYISDLLDVRNRKVARDLIGIDVKIFPVGRLDYNSEGLMIFTNDGDLANTIMHPRYGVEKEYLVKFKGILNVDEMRQIKKGINVKGEIYKVKSVKYVRLSVKNAWYSVLIDEGKNRMIRKIGDAIDHPVLKLKRVRIGNLVLGDLKPGEYRFFDKKELL
ncbi:MAG: Ribosomal large subunit pseudouridine synthase B [Syntrophorhabdus sp. PtaU1.Bin058]|nr:MAG: Ribosomal large subunit pseudouridine synthase B [Syntrophorhabdus sp. PtaU1.Bin058]